MNNKLKNTRVVTFKEDYHSKPGALLNADPIYRKGESHAIHFKLVDKLRESGAKIDAKPFDEQASIAKRKKILADNRKKMSEAAQ